MLVFLTTRVGTPPSRVLLTEKFSFWLLRGWGVCEHEDAREEHERRFKRVLNRSKLGVIWCCRVTHNGSVRKHCTFQGYTAIDAVVAHGVSKCDRAIRS